MPQVSSPTEDPVQPQPEQVAPPTVTVTNGCPKLPSSGDNAHPPAAKTGNTITPDTRNVIASRTEIKPRKRKRVNGKFERNVNKKQSKTTCPESPREASSPDASNDELTLVVKLRRGEAVE